MSDAARLTIGRDYCRGCETRSVQKFAGWVTPDGHENSDRPRGFYRQCEQCGMTRIVLGNVNDAEGLCRKVLKKWLKRSHTGATVGATGKPFGDGALDAEEGLAFLTTEVWRLYCAWEPARSDGSFLAYASELLPRRLNSWSRKASGEIEERAGGRRFPKAHAASVSVSLDGIRDSSRDVAASGEELRGVRYSASAGRSSSSTDSSLGGFFADHAETGSLDLLRVLAEGGRGRAGAEQGPGNAASGRLAAED